MRVTYHPEAEEEVVGAARYYEEQCPELGGRFLDEVDRAILTILDAPARWKIVGGNVRCYLLPRFPFAIYYRLRPDDEVRVLAVKHHARHPDYWLHRTDGN